MTFKLTLTLAELSPVARGLSTLVAGDASPVLARLFQEAQPQANAGASVFDWVLSAEDIASLETVLDEALDRAAEQGELEILGDLGVLRDRIRTLDGV
jgi:hypothetical protein